MSQLRPARPPFRRRMLVRDVATTIGGFLIGLGAFQVVLDQEPFPALFIVAGIALVYWNWR